MQPGLNQFSPLLPTAFVGPGSHGQPQSADRFQHVFRLQLQISAGYRVRIDRQLAGHLAHRRDQLADADRAVGHRKLDLPHDLVVDRQIVRGVYVDEHPMVSCTRYPVQ